ncbi:FmdB family zinc ribbon protein [Brevibacillus daliensis]|uniref:FmdB family zinc ribbon protein n=1 Tax=Brevibacillus daliensis TaxID=2892995 RepID=UPI001E578F7F|nr:FmdB family zinc ribbon protein [Brevibacillus daliensis]
MPTYLFQCQECGPFEETMSMSQVTERIDCPFCEQEATRLYTAPGLITSSSVIRKRIEESAMPKVVKREHSHSHSCGHGTHSHSATTAAGKASPKRPWQASH